ncbi:TadE family type IV pilus minor pilin [Pseudonocardia nematodicida]|uniref:TadE family type IV pilus minor pilin n=1 Tax=Pseudonocardia nematodicida TaxID=1206997 RepID=A0ABV1K937_9PSEU
MPCRRRSDPGPGPGTGDAGAVTVEAAMALGTLVLVTAAAIAAVAAVAAGVRCTDAARELARQAARGDADTGRAAAAALAPTGAETELRLDGDTVVATVRVRPVGLLPVAIGGSAVAVAEPGLAAETTTPPGSGYVEPDGLGPDPAEPDVAPTDLADPIHPGNEADPRHRGNEAAPRHPGNEPEAPDPAVAGHSAGPAARSGSPAPP